MNTVVHWLRIGIEMVVAVVAITATYVGICFLSYGSPNLKGPKLPGWFTAGFDYAMDETPLRWPLLHVADSIGIRDWHELRSYYRRAIAWRTRCGMNDNGDRVSCQMLMLLTSEMDAYYASREASFFPSSVRVATLTAEVDDLHPLVFGKDWEEFHARLAVSKAEHRCQE